MKALHSVEKEVEGSAVVNLVNVVEQVSEQVMKGNKTIFRSSAQICNEILISWINREQIEEGAYRQREL
jgi:hypothetical protein